MSEQIDINAMKSRIGQSMLADRFQLRRLLDSVQRSRSSGRPFDRNLKHLKDNGVDLDKTPPTLVAALAIDPKDETFLDHPQDDNLLTRPYRDPFVVPKESAI